MMDAVGNRCSNIGVACLAYTIVFTAFFPSSGAIVLSLSAQLPSHLSFAFLCRIL